MTLIDKIAGNVRKYRTMRNISQRELARKADLSLSLVNWIECSKRDNVTIRTLEKIGNVLHVSVVELMGK